MRRVSVDEVGASTEPAAKRGPTVIAIAGIFTAVSLGVLRLSGAVAANLDDAFIVLVYARHFASSGRIFWNVEDGPVDGFTSMLDMLLKAGLVRLFPSDPFRDGHALVLVTYVASVVVGAALVHFAAARGPSRSRRGLLLGFGGSFLAALCFGVNPALAWAASFLLETPLYACLALGSVGMLVFADLRRTSGAVGSVLVWCLLALVRPEGAGLVVVEMALAALPFAEAEEGSRTGRSLAPGLLRRAAPFAATSAFMVVYLVWHRLALGAWAPNTFYAKSSGSRWQEILDGVAYTRAYAARSFALGTIVAATFLAPLLALVPRAWSSSADRRRFVMAALVTLTAGVGVIVEGGDSYAGGRFYAVPITLCILTLSLAEAGMVRVWRLLPLAPLTALLVYAVPGCFPSFDVRLRRIADWPADQTRYACEAAAARAVGQRAHVVAETDDQRFKYFVDDARVIDATGLNDRQRAHRPTEQATKWGKGSLADAVDTGAEVLVLGLWPIQEQPMARVSAGRVASEEVMTAYFLGFVPFPAAARQPLVASYRTVSVPSCSAYFNAFARDDIAPRFELTQDTLAPPDE